MRKMTLAALAAALVATVFLYPAVPPATAGVGVCDPQRGRLCWGLVDWWSFNEPGQDAQFGSFANTPLYELDGVDHGGYTTKGGTFDDALSFGGNSYLFAPRWGSLPSYFTVAFWVKADRVNVRQTLVSNLQENVGTSVLGNYGGILLEINSSGKPTITAFIDEKDSTTYASYVYGGTAMTTTDWYMLVYKVSPYGPYGQAQACVSVTKAGDGSPGAFNCSSAFTYNVKPALGDLMIAGDIDGTYYFDGGIDSFGIWARAWDSDDLASYYKSNSGRQFPFGYSD